MISLFEFLYPGHYCLVALCAGVTVRGVNPSMWELRVGSFPYKPQKVKKIPNWLVKFLDHPAKDLQNLYNM